MNKKVIIQIVIIVGAFFAAGFVLYNGLYNNDSVATAPIGAATAKNNEKILPHGNTLNFKSDLFTRDFQFGAMSYSQVDPSEVGVVDSSLVISQTAQK